MIAGANRVRWREQWLELAARPGADLDALARRGLQRRALEVFEQRLIYETERDTAVANARGARASVEQAKGQLAQARASAFS